MAPLAAVVPRAPGDDVGPTVCGIFLPLNINHLKPRTKGPGDTLDEVPAAIARTPDGRNNPPNLDKPVPIALRTFVSAPLIAARDGILAATRASSCLAVARKPTFNAPCRAIFAANANLPIGIMVVITVVAIYTTCSVRRTHIGGRHPNRSRPPGIPPASPPPSSPPNSRFR